MATVNSDKLQQLFKLIEREPNDTFLLYGVAMEYKKLGAPEKAIEQFDRVIQVDPNYCYAYYQKGQVLEQSGHPDAARQAYRDGIVAAQRAGDDHARSELQAALDLL